jgi:type II secretory pathway pseudopilin PulG
VAQRGYTYIGLLILIALAGLALSLAGEVWQTATRRDNEKQLLFAGNQYRQAIGRYYARSPGSARELPAKLEDLLLDKRFPGIERHLRMLYPDPLTSTPNWGVVTTAEGRISGVYSMAAGVPMKQAGFDPADSEFAGAKRYADWRFVFQEGAGAKPEGGGEASPDGLRPTPASRQTVMPQGKK